MKFEIVQMLNIENYKINLNIIHLSKRKTNSILNNRKYLNL